MLSARWQIQHGAGVCCSECVPARMWCVLWCELASGHNNRHYSFAYSCVNVFSFYARHVSDLWKTTLNDCPYFPPLLCIFDWWLLFNLCVTGASSHTGADTGGRRVHSLQTGLLWARGKNVYLWLSCDSYIILFFIIFYCPYTSFLTTWLCRCKTSMTNCWLICRSRDQG